MSERALARGLAGLLACDLLLVTLHLLVFTADPPGQLSSAMFGLDREANLPTWFSSTKLLLVGICLLWASRTAVASDEAPGGWLVLAGLAFVFLSADEAASIHESVTWVLRPVDWFPRFAGGHGLWIPIYGVVGFSGVVAARPLWQWMRKSRPRALGLLVLGAALFALGAVGLEIVSYGDLRDPALRGLYLIQVAIEEGFELVGASFLLVGAALLVVGTELAAAAQPDRTRSVNHAARLPAERRV